MKKINTAWVKEKYFHPSETLTRRDFLKFSTASLASASFLTSGCHDLQTAEPVRRPNILFLVTDDQRWDTLGVVNPLIETPNMDDLSKNGVMFTNAFVTTSICCSSRASIFTGQSASRHRIHNFSTQFTPEQLVNTYPMQLKQAGYRIGFIGKYGVGNKNLPEKNYDYWKGFPGQGHYEKNTDEKGNPIHLTRLLGNQALDFLDGCTSDQPFCLSISFKAPHCQDGDPRQFIYDPAYKDLYRDVTLPPAQNGSEEDWQRFPEFFKKDNEGRTRWKLRFSTPEKYQEMVKRYYRLIYGVDVQIGGIRKKLEEMNAADNTIIIFIGDNGFFLGEHGLAGKWFPYEESIRVPLIIYDPRLPTSKRSRKCDQMALNIDLAPTVLSYARVPVPEVMQGCDLMPLVEGKSIPWRNDFFYEHHLPNDQIPENEALVGQRYKYIRYTTQTPVYEELYDLKTDPGELRNLTGDPDYTSILEKQRKRFFELKRQAEY